MFDITSLPRATSRDEWRRVYTIVRRLSDRAERVADNSLIAERGEHAARVHAVAEHGRVAVIESGRDCDCVEFLHSSLADAVPLALWRDAEHAREWADGPLYVSYCAPSKRPRSHSRDLALEAFENGHAHCVTSATV